MIEVIYEYSVRCPRCALEDIKKICEELNVPFIPRYMHTHNVVISEESVATQTMSPSWMMTWGTPEQRKKLKKLLPVMLFLRSIRANPVPVIRIRFHDGARLKEIVIRGYNPHDKEAVKQFLTNLRVLLKTLKEVLER